MTCARCEELKAEIKALKAELYPEPGDPIMVSAKWVTGFTQQQAEVVAVLYRAAGGLEVEALNERVSAYTGERLADTMKTQICVMRRRLPGCVVSNRAGLSGRCVQYSLSPEIRKRITAHLKEAQDHDRHSEQDRYTRWPDDADPPQATRV